MTTTTRKSGKKATHRSGKAKTARREASDERRAQLADLAREALADPALGARIAAMLTAGAAPKMFRYSVRNQALLARQADERGITLSDVDTYKGWAARGRQVRRGEKGLQIVRPSGRKAKDADAKAAAGKAEETAQDGEKEQGKTRFCLMTVFDRSQTDGIEGFEAEAPAVETEPEAALMEALTAQADRAGYLLTVWDDAEAEHAEEGTVTVDHDANVINVYGGPTPEALAELINTVAAVVVAHEEELAEEAEAEELALSF